MEGYPSSVQAYSNALVPCTQSPHSLDVDTVELDFRQLTNELCMVSNLTMIWPGGLGFAQSSRSERHRSFNRASRSFVCQPEAWSEPRCNQTDR